MTPSARCPTDRGRAAALAAFRVTNFVGTPGTSRLAPVQVRGREVIAETATLQSRIYHAGVHLGLAAMMTSGGKPGA